MIHVLYNYGIQFIKRYTVPVEFLGLHIVTIVSDNLPDLQ